MKWRHRKPIYRCILPAIPAFVAAIWSATLQAGTAPNNPAVKIAVQPAVPLIEERSEFGYINFDFVVDNTSGDDLDLVALRLITSDVNRAPISIKELNPNGTNPSILTMPDRHLNRGTASLLFNPFYALDMPRDIAELCYVFTWRTAAGVESSSRKCTEPKAAAKRPSLLPLEGRILVWDGHDFYSHHRRWNYLLPSLAKAGYKGNAGRYAYDFVAVDPSGRSVTGDESVNSNWMSFGRQIFAPADGTVVGAQSDQPDDRTWHRRSDDPNSIFGNYVLVEHPDHTFSIIGHMMKGSLVVAIGERIKAGTPLGRVGASGDSLFPHLLYQRSTTPNDFGEGVPVQWPSAFRQIGSLRSTLQDGFIDTGDIVTR